MTSQAESTPIGVASALRATSDLSFTPRPTIQKELGLTGRVVIISGGNRGIGLEMAEALCEAGAIVYCLDLPDKPGSEWVTVHTYVSRLLDACSIPKIACIKYVSVDVTDQKRTWDIVEQIAAKEGRLDVCIACAGILAGAECLEYPANEFQKIINVNVNGVFHTAQAAGRQMVKYGNGGSIILIASMSGSISNRDQHWIAYNTSKAAVVQMARSLACELGPKRIRVNSISPGYILTAMTEAFLDKNPDLQAEWASQNPLGRIGRPEELRGVALWLASDSSTYCTGSDIIVDGGHRAW